MKLWLKFTLFMTLALAAVMSLAGFVLYSNASDVAERAQEAVMVASVRLTGQFAPFQARVERLEAETAGLLAAEQEFSKAEIRLEPEVLQIRENIKAQRMQRAADLQVAMDAVEAFRGKQSHEEKSYGDNQTFSYPLNYGPEQKPGSLFRFRGEKDFDLLVPADVNEAQKGLLRIIQISTLAVILVAAAIALFVASTVSRPIGILVKDIQQIQKGHLSHRTKGEGGGEVGQLAISINKMAKGLAEARETEFTLKVREREVALAGEVRESLIPQATPELPGFDVAALHLFSQDLGGDFHDFLELPDGRLGLLVADVSGKGLPGALVGATARAYLQSELARGGDVREALCAVNRVIARDMRRGMYVTVLYALIDPKAGVATVACTGHKMPLVRYSAADGKVRVVHPEGIALGFDNGPIFDRKLEVAAVPLEKGDRLLLVNTGTVAVTNPAGVELGEKPIYAVLQKHGAGRGQELLDRLRQVVETHAAGKALPRDVSIVSIART